MQWEFLYPNLFYSILAADSRNSNLKELFQNNYEIFVEAQLSMEEDFKKFTELLPNIDEKSIKNLWELLKSS